MLEGGGRQEEVHREDRRQRLGWKKNLTASPHPAASASFVYLVGEGGCVM